MAEIEEIPINAGEAQESEKNIPENNEEIPEDIPENTAAPKKRGRPAGAKNKPKPPAPKVKSKPKPKAKTKEPEYEDWSEEDDEPPPPRRRAARPTRAEPIELDRHALASEVLGILQQQRYNQTSAKRNHYASWFANM